MLLKDKVLIVTGIGPGMGVKVPAEAARQGARGVVIATRNAARLDEAEELVKATGTNCRVVKVPTDISDAAQCKRLAETAHKEFGRIDCLVNSAYAHGDSVPMESTSADNILNVLKTNMVGTVQMTQAVVPFMKAQGGGAIVIINTMATMKPLWGEGIYAASKGALQVSAKYLAMELGPHNIRVNSTRMGWMWGAPVEQGLQMMADAQGLKFEDVKKGVEQNIPLRRIPTDLECARAALFLVSDFASAVTGATLDVNGGEVMTI
jgi:NAD(P)-dependent dehydrogenase (short-subunit alcohol dehydrogenase family)